MGEGVEAEPDWDIANQSPTDYLDDQRTDWLKTRFSGRFTLRSILGLMRLNFRSYPFGLQQRGCGWSWGIVGLALCVLIKMLSECDVR